MFPLDEQGWVAVRAMVCRAQAQPVMDQLWQVGTRAILVTLWKSDASELQVTWVEGFVEGGALGEQPLEPICVEKPRVKRIGGKVATTANTAL